MWKYVWRLVLAVLMGGAMYCLWMDAVSPAAQRIVQLVVLFEFGLYFLSLVFLFQITPLQRWLDALLPPVVAIGTAWLFWGLPDWFLAIAFLVMIFFSALCSSTTACARVYQWLGTMNLSTFRKKRLSIVVTLILVAGFAYLSVTAGFHGFPIHFILFPFLIVIVYSLYCFGVFLYPVVLLLFFAQKRSWKAWLGMALYTALWLGLLSQTFPLRAWWMVQFVDPCYKETIGGRNATYEKLSGTDQVCFLPTGESPFNVATRHTLKNFDPEQFVEQQQILDDGSLKTMYIPKDEYQINQ